MTQHTPRIALVGDRSANVRAHARIPRLIDALLTRDSIAVDPYWIATPDVAECDLSGFDAIWLVPGSHFERVDDKLYNTALVIDPSGAVVARYRKMFPFLPYETAISPGTEFCVFDVPAVGRFGLSICYDMWFPETTRTLAAKMKEHEIDD